MSPIFWWVHIRRRIRRTLFVRYWRPFGYRISYWRYWNCVAWSTFTDIATIGTINCNVSWWYEQIDRFFIESESNRFPFRSHTLAFLSPIICLSQMKSFVDERAFCCCGIAHNVGRAAFHKIKYNHWIQFGWFRLTWRHSPNLALFLSCVNPYTNAYVRTSERQRQFVFSRSSQQIEHYHQQNFDHFVSGEERISSENYSPFYLHTYTCISYAVYTHPKTNNLWSCLCAVRFRCLHLNRVDI